MSISSNTTLMPFGQKRYKAYLKQIRRTACSHFSNTDLYDMFNLNS